MSVGQSGCPAARPLAQNVTMPEQGRHDQGSHDQQARPAYIGIAQIRDCKGKSQGQTENRR